MFENIEKTLTIMLLAIGGQSNNTVLLRSYFSKIFQNFLVNTQCLSEIEGTPTELKTL